MKKLHPSPTVPRAPVISRVQEQLDVAMLHVALVLAHGPHCVIVRSELHVGLPRSPTCVILEQAHVHGNQGLKELLLR